MDLAARVTVESPWRITVSTSLGVMPGPFVSLINEVATGFGWYDDTTAALIRSTLETSLVWRTHLGWRPFVSLGLYVEAGYGLVTLGGSATTEEIIEALTAEEAAAAAGGKTYNASSTLHMIDVELGYVWDLGESGWYLQTALGFAGTLGSSTEVTPAFTPRAPQLVARFSDGLERYLDDIYQSYVFTPVVTLGAGYRFAL